MTTRRRSFQIAVGAVLCSCGLAAAQQFTLGDGNSTARFNTNTIAGQDQWLVNGVNHMNQQWFWIRAGADTRENPINSLTQLSAQATDTNTASDSRNDTLNIQYRNAASTFTVETNFTLRGGIGPILGSDITEQLRIVNTQASGSLSFSFFQYVDLNINNTATDTTGQIRDGQIADQSEAGVGASETVVTSLPSRFQMALTPAIINSLNDTAITNLSNAAGPVGPGDISWGFQWDFTLLPGQSFLISKDKQLTPAPGALALLGLGGLVAARRRRS